MDRMRLTHYERLLGGECARAYIEFEDATDRSGPPYPDELLPWLQKVKREDRLECIAAAAFRSRLPQYKELLVQQITRKNRAGLEAQLLEQRLSGEVLGSDDRKKLEALRGYLAEVEAWLERAKVDLTEEDARWFRLVAAYGDPTKKAGY
jgi:hypothetical protein